MDFLRALEQAKSHNIPTDQFIHIWQAEQQRMGADVNIYAHLQSVHDILVSHLQALHKETMLLRQEVQHTNGRLDEMFRELVTLRTVTAEETKNNLELMKIYAQQEIRLQLDHHDVRLQLEQQQVSSSLDQEFRSQPDQREVRSNLDQREVRSNLDQREVRSSLDQREVRSQLDQRENRSQLDQREVSSQLDQRENRSQLDQRENRSQLDHREVSSQLDQHTTPNGHHEWHDGHNLDNGLPLSESWADAAERESSTPIEFPIGISSIWSPQGSQSWEQEIRLQHSEWPDYANKVTEDDDSKWQETRKKSKKQGKELSGITMRSDFQGLLPPASEPAPSNGTPVASILIQEMYPKTIPQGRSYLDGVRCRKIERSNSNLNLSEDILGFPERGSISKINNARKFFSTKQDIKTDFVTDMRNKSYRIRLRLWVKENSLQVQVLVSEGINGAQQKWPVMLLGSGHLFNPRTRKHAELWSLHCKCSKPAKGGEVALNATVNLSGNCPLVTYDVLESKFYVEDNSLKFLWELSAYATSGST